MIKSLLDAWSGWVVMLLIGLLSGEDQSQSYVTTSVIYMHIYFPPQALVTDALILTVRDSPPPQERWRG